MKFKIKKFLLVSVLIGIILFSICPKVFATNGNEMSISSKDGIGNTIEIISGSTNSIRSESVADVVSYLSGQNITVNSITNHKGVLVELTSTALIGTGYVLDTNNGNYSVIVYGDANGDGEADAGDMKIIIDNFLGIKQASQIAKIAVDVYQDGDLDAADLKQVLDGFLGNLTGSILKTTSVSNPTPTPDVSVTPTPTPTPTPEVTGPQIKIGNQTVVLTPQNAPEYYGQVVTNYNQEDVTYRLFYVDFNGDFGTKETIYLKADQIITTALDITASASSTDALVKMKQVNPDWAVNDGTANENNEKGVLWLCDETKWIDYKDESKADCVIGAPSIEMYVKSYNAYHSKKGTSGYQQLKCKWYNKKSDGYSRGYMYSVANNSYEFRTAENSLKIDANNMYINSEQYWWLASPSANGADGICNTYGITLCLNRNAYTSPYGICPLVSLKSNFIPEISDSTPTPVVTGSQIKIGNQTVTLTPDNAPEYYGKVVTNYNQANATYRLFYVDFDGDFGTEGTIYLKADQVSTTTLNTASSTTSLEKMKQLNPQWRNRTANNNNELTVLWLCDENNWSKYKDASKADYVVGAPSIEMYVKSYNAYHSKKGTSGYQQLNCKWFSSNVSGYKCALGTSVNDDSYVYYTNSNALKTDENNLYVKSGEYWWLASPSAEGAYYVFIVASGTSILSRSGPGISNGISPLVSLKSDFIPEFEN